MTLQSVWLRMSTESNAVAPSTKMRYFNIGMVGGILTAARVGIWCYEHRESLGKVGRATMRTAQSMHELGSIIGKELLHRG